MIYLSVFTIVIALTYLYEHSGKNAYEKYYHIFLEIVIVMLPALLGGFRAITVGSDNLNYNEVFQYCTTHSLYDAFKTGGYISEDLEIGFMFLTWILSKLGKNYFFFAFTTSVITFALFFEGVKYFKERFSMTIMVMCYLYIYYCPMYNYVRQGVALAIIFYALRYAEERKFGKYLLMVLIAATMHLSAIVGIAIYFVFVFKDKIKFNKYIVITIIAVIVVICAGPSLMYNILVAVADIGFRTETLLKYSRRFLWASNYSFIPVHMLRSLPQLIVSSLFYKRMAKIDSSIKCYYILCWIQFPLMIFGSVFEPFSRISIYFNYSEFVLLAALVKGFKNSRYKNLIKISLIVFCIAYWYFFTVMNYYGFKYPVYPYVAA